METRTAEHLEQLIIFWKHKASLASEMFNYPKKGCIITNGTTAIVIPEQLDEYVREFYQRIAEHSINQVHTLEAELSKTKIAI